MISTEQEARAAVAKVGPDAVRLCAYLTQRFFGGTYCPAVLQSAASIFREIGKPRKSSQLFRCATEWAAARGGAK